MNSEAWNSFVRILIWVPFVAALFPVPPPPQVLSIDKMITHGSLQGISNRDISIVYFLRPGVNYAQESVSIQSDSQCTTEIKVYYRWGALPCSFSQNTEDYFFCEEDTISPFGIAPGSISSVPPSDGTSTFVRNQTLYIGLGKADLNDESDCTFTIGATFAVCPGGFYAADTGTCVPFYTESNSQFNINPTSSPLIEIPPKTESIDIKISSSGSGLRLLFADGTIQTISGWAADSVITINGFKTGFVILQFPAGSTGTVTITKNICPNSGCYLTDLTTTSFNVPPFFCAYLYKDLLALTQDYQCSYTFQGSAPSTHVGMNQFGTTEAVNTTYRFIAEDSYDGSWISFGFCAKNFSSTVSVTCTDWTIPSPTPSSSPRVPSGSSPGTNKGKDNTELIIIIAVAGGGGLLLLILLVIIFLLARKKSRQTDSDDSSKFSNKSLELSGMQPVTQIKQDDIKILGKIGEGAFGEVYRGVYAKTIDVALKRLTNPSHMEEFEQEASILQNLKHPHIVLCLGIYLAEDGSKYIVTEYMSKGSLQDLLRLKRDSVSEEELLCMAKDAAAGMAHLELQNVIHRDLATRNLLVSGSEHELCIKVADFGMSRVMNSETYSSHAVHFPVKWSAPEVLRFRNYTLKSDVWAYGITLWEIFSAGAVPYSAMSNMKSSEFVLEGGRLDKPDRCPDALFSLMKSCWEELPENRPTFQEIYSIVSGLATSDARKNSEVHFSGYQHVAENSQSFYLEPSVQEAARFHEDVDPYQQ